MADIGKLPTLNIATTYSSPTTMSLEDLTTLAQTPQGQDLIGKMDFSTVEAGKFGTQSLGERLGSMFGADGKGGILGMSKGTTATLGNGLGLGLAGFSAFTNYQNMNNMKDYYNGQLDLQRHQQSNVDNEINRLNKQRTSMTKSYMSHNPNGLAAKSVTATA